MNRIRLLVIRAHRDLSHEQRERILVSNFVRGLWNKSLATYFATVNPKTAAEAKRIAGSGEAIYRARKSAQTFMVEEQASGSSMQGDDFFTEQDQFEAEDGDDEVSELVAAIADLKSKFNGRGRFRGRGRGRGFSNTRRECYNCGSPDHLVFECPKPKTVKPFQQPAQRSNQQSDKCGLCGAAHVTRACPHWELAKKMLKEHNDSKKAESVTAFADDEDKALVVLELPEWSPVQVIDPAMPAPEYNLSGNGRTRLFFVPAIVQNRYIHMLADSGSVRNLINDKFFDDLQYKPKLRPPGDCRVVGCNNQAQPLRGFAVLPVIIQSVVLWHEFGVVANFPLNA